jgi:hypothetical protein
VRAGPLVLSKDHSDATLCSTVCYRPLTAFFYIPTVES